MDIIFTEADRIESAVVPVEEDDPDFDITYSVDLRVALFRLAVSGHTLTAAKKAYNNWDRYKKSGVSPYFAKERMNDAFYQAVDFEKYLDLERLITSETLDMNNLTGEIKYMIENDAYLPHAFPSDDVLHSLVCRLSTLGNDGTLSVDLEEMISEDSFDRNEKLGSDDDMMDYVIVIPEGKTDSRAIKWALEILEPSLAHSIRLFDFSFGPPGGTGVSVNLVKSLAAAGFTDLILMLFDNDSAGLQAYQECLDVRLPNNFLIHRYPNIEYAKNYPTYGPSGLTSLDINGKACGIELYLGRDCLLDDNGSELPVQWTGYMKKVNQYQGELIDKDKPMKKYDEKYEASKKSGSPIGDWNEMRAILHSIYDRVIAH